MRIINFTVPHAYDGRQVRCFLYDFGVSSSLLKKLKNTENGIMLNGIPARAVDLMKKGDCLTIEIAQSGSMPAPAKNHGAAIEYEDEDVVVMLKPPGMPVHESRNHRGDTLANAAACFLEKESAFRAVYRLDRDTGGLVLIAKNELAACKLAGRIKKDYYAVCSGVLEGSGTIDLPIRRVRESIITRGVFDDGERAVTHWQALKCINNRTLLKINLETGRTHQIRVHFSHAGHPLLGDTLYGGDDGLIKRQALQCKTIYFTHPVTGDKITVDSELPDDFKGLI